MRSPLFPLQKRRFGMMGNVWISLSANLDIYIYTLKYWIAARWVKVNLFATWTCTCANSHTMAIWNPQTLVIYSIIYRRAVLSQYLFQAGMCPVGRICCRLRCDLWLHLLLPFRWDGYADEPWLHQMRDLAQVQTERLAARAFLTLILRVTCFLFQFGSSSDRIRSNTGPAKKTFLREDTWFASQKQLWAVITSAPVQGQTSTVSYICQIESLVFEGILCQFYANTTDVLSHHPLAQVKS